MTDIDDDSQSETLKEYSDRLAVYMNLQGTDADRAAPMGTPPWPDEDNEMLAYLINRAMEMCTNAQTADAPIAEWMPRISLWIAVHAWYEGGLAERSRSRAT